MKAKLFTLLLLILPICLMAQNYEKEGDDLFAQAQYEKAAKKYDAAIAIVGESPTLKQKQTKCSKCKTLLVKALSAEKETRYGDAAKHYSDLYALHPLVSYQTKANSMTQKAKLVEEERLTKIKEERDRIAKKEAEEQAEKQRQLNTKRGTCGESLKWELYDGVLSIIGTGTMFDARCESGAPWYTSKSEITSVIVQEGVTIIGKYAFYGCRALTSISLPNSLSCIGNHAFYGCENLRTITIPNGVTEIGSYAFYGCYNFESISIPNSITTIRDYSFSSCGNLKSIILSENTTVIDNNAFSYCVSLTSITIPSNVKNIGKSAFAGCRSLKDIIFNDCHKSIYISSKAFAGCIGLKSVRLPRAALLAEGVFDGVSNIKIYNGEWDDID